MLDLLVIIIIEIGLIRCLFLIIDVDIHWHERDSIMISPVHKEDFGIGGLAKYEVSTVPSFI